MPNPGRLWELLFPGVTLYVTEPKTSDGKRKTKYTVVGVVRDGAPIFLHTHLNNIIAGHLLERRLVPGLEKADIVKAEATHGRSRFDFLMQEDGHEFYLEVKSVTLFGNEVAMFPDAVTERGRRHLEDLAALSTLRQKSAVIFQAHSPKLRYFLPDYHTDLEFGRALLAHRDDLRVLPIALKWTEDLELSGKPKLLDVPWEYLEQEIVDRGSLLVQLRYKRARRVMMNGGVSLRIEPGYYVFVMDVENDLSRVGEAMRAARRSVHSIYSPLMASASERVVMPVRGSQGVACAMAKELGGFLQSAFENDFPTACRCASHIFRCDGPPLDSQEFHQRVLLAFRLRRPG